MIASLLLLAIVVFGLRILFGQGKIEDYLKFLVWLIFAPVLVAVGYNHIQWFWLGLPFWIKVLSLLLVPFLISAVLHAMFPKTKWLQAVEATILQLLVFLVSFPFRFLWRMSSFMFQRERRTVRLDPHRPVVGNRPPLVAQRK